jgi:hypothetical protein
MEFNIPYMNPFDSDDNKVIIPYIDPFDNNSGLNVGPKVRPNVGQSAKLLNGCVLQERASKKHNLNRSQFNFNDDIVSYDSKIGYEYDTDTNKYNKEYNKKYDKQTTEYYKAMRLGKFDIISHKSIPVELMFKFERVWDPLTGERLEEDNIGPLCFDVHYLIKHIYTNRLNKLWVNPVDEGSSGNYYEGYYDDGVNAGETFNIVGRGYHPEWYLFRLPVPDCYLSQDHNSQLITFGPKLTDDEINDIYNKANINRQRYKKLFNKSLPNLMKIYELYHIAISNTSSNSDARKAVESLKKM